MCLAIVALDTHPRYPLIIVANRDEFHKRSAASATWWDTPARMFAGRDLEAGGTWLGITPSGRWAFVTNVREPGRRDVQAPSRGELVPAVLANAHDVDDALRDLQARADRYNGFNLLAGEGRHAAWMSNRVDRVHRLAPGVHGVSNAQLDTPWPKLRRLKAGVAQWAQQGHDDPEPLFRLLADREIAGDGELPRTGVPLEWERLLSAPFIVSEGYGTRCSTVITIDDRGRVRFIERSFAPDARRTTEVDETFSLASAEA
ncbi:MAG TPA: NRDE family protein [Casimicrobiaceae bacterium]|nr:NRDE family protein [Casimicrobiaceae bacterium]